MYKLVTDDTQCDTNVVIYINVNNHVSLKQKLKKLNYDHSGTLDGYIKNTGYKFIEEVIAHKDNIEIITDSSIVDYLNFTFVLNICCTNRAIVNIKEENSLCADCYNKTNHPEFNKLKKMIENPIKYLSVSKKIIYILKTNMIKMGSKDIYENGKPWNITGSTPINTIQARCSSLHKSGIIKKESDKYFT